MYVAVSQDDIESIRSFIHPFNIPDPVPYIMLQSTLSMRCKITYHINDRMHEKEEDLPCTLDPVHCILLRPLTIAPPPLQPVWRHITNVRQ